jgi:hypothetical protein
MGISRQWERGERRREVRSTHNEEPPGPQERPGGFSVAARRAMLPHTRPHVFQQSDGSLMPRLRPSDAFLGPGTITPRQGVIIPQWAKVTGISADGWGAKTAFCDSGSSFRWGGRKCRAPRHVGNHQLRVPHLWEEQDWPLGGPLPARSAMARASLRMRGTPKARALIKRPTLILADEPTGQLDTLTGASIIALLKTIATQTGVTVVVASHDPNVHEAADRILELKDGRLVGTVDQSGGAST